MHYCVFILACIAYIWESVLPIRKYCLQFFFLYQQNTVTLFSAIRWISTLPKISFPEQFHHYQPWWFMSVCRIGNRARFISHMYVMKLSFSLMGNTGSYGRWWFVHLLQNKQSWHTAVKGFPSRRSLFTQVMGLLFFFYKIITNYTPLVCDGVNTTCKINRGLLLRWCIEITALAYTR